MPTNTTSQVNSSAIGLNMEALSAFGQGRDHTKLLPQNLMLNSSRANQGIQQFADNNNLGSAALGVPQINQMTGGTCEPGEEKDVKENFFF